MLNLSDKQERLLRQLLDKTEKFLSEMVTDCTDPSEYGQCREATKCRILIEDLKKEIGLIEDRPDKGNSLINGKLF